MDEISNKAISIGVAIFITIAITSGVFYVINQIKNIYGQVYNTDVSIQSSFSEFDAYDNTQKTGIDVLNAIKKYLGNPLVKIIIDNTEINSNSAFYTTYKSKIGTNDYTNYLSKLGEQKYNSKIIFTESTGVTNIVFNKK